MAEADLLKLRRWLKSGFNLERQAFYLHFDGACDGPALARGLSTLFPEPVVLLEPSGTYVTADEGRDVVAAMHRNETLLVIARGEQSIAEGLLKVWTDATRRVFVPGGSSSPRRSYWDLAGRHLPIRVVDGEPRALVVVLQLGSRSATHGSWNWGLTPTEVLELEARGASMRRCARSIGVPSRAEEAAGRLSFKELCLLHLRDGPLATERSADTTTELRATPVTWLDLQAFLRKGKHMELALADLHRRGLLEAEKHEFYLLATDYLEERTGSSPLSDIYEAVWRYEFLENSAGYFRGHTRSHWKLNTTLLREAPGQEAQDVLTLAVRVERTSLFLSELRKRAAEVFARPPSDEEMLAVAQHYGFPTSLLDFSRSIRVAAFFATDGSDRHTSPERAVGVIYHIAPGDRRAKRLLDRTQPVGLGGFDLLRDAGLHFGQWSAIEPALDDHDNRIARQQGAFLEGANVRHLGSSAVLQRILFWQRPTETFEDPHAGVTRARLLPDDSELAKLAADVERRFKAGERVPIDAAFARVTLPAPSIVGAQHGWLEDQVDEAVEFFSLLDKFADTPGGQPVVDRAIAGIQEYFASVSTIADLGALPAQRPGESSSASPLRLAVARLCERSQVPVKAVWSTLDGLIPEWDDGTWRAPDLDGDYPLDHWVVLACALYLIGWEHITSVQGPRARAFSLKAREILHFVLNHPDRQPPQQGKAGEVDPGAHDNP